MLVRPAALTDLPAITAIYADAVAHGTATFDVDPPEPGDLRRRFEELRGFPYLVAERDGRVLGYAYAAPFRLRRAYASTVEDSVYLAPDARGRGIGRQLLESLIVASEADGHRAMVALIGDSESASSIGLHAACGFTKAGVLRSVGFKHGRWLDVVLMERRLGAFDTQPPTRG